MPTEEFKIVFQPSGSEVFVLPGTPLLEAAVRAGIVLNSPCGGTGQCGKCRVRITAGLANLADARTGLEGQADTEPGACLACVARANGPMTVTIPESSLFESRHNILTGDTGLRAALDPLVRKAAFELPPPSGQDPRSDEQRLRDGFGSDLLLPSTILRELPGFLRTNEWRGTAVLHGNRLVGLEPGHASRPPYGLALDIGTTTVVATLIDLASGQEKAVAGALNGQRDMGDDVLSRILRVRENPANLAVLQQAVRDTINGLIQAVTRRARIEPRDIHDVVAAGNTAMQQLLCGYDPSALGERPFAPVFQRGHALPCTELGLDTHPQAQLHVFPQIGGFVGGDTLAGILAACLDRHQEPFLFVDIGTNGEIVAGENGKMLATSVAAGPAFEGARIVQGMCAVPGAIEKTLLENDVHVNVIGNVAPSGLCGTGLIDTAAEMLRLGILDETGRILTGAELPASLPAALRDRVVDENGQPCLELVRAGEHADGPAVRLRQKDIRELQLATAAVRAGIGILLRQAELDLAEIGEILVAGGFGNFIRRRNAVRIGLLPAVPLDRIRFIGNAASLGAKRALLSLRERAAAETICRTVRHVDLSLDPAFQNEFGEAMIFPCI